MNLYVKTDKFGVVLDECNVPVTPIRYKKCTFLTSGKVYKAVSVGAISVFIKNDFGVSTFLTVSDETISDHTNSHWYFCDEQGNRLEDN